MKPDHLRTAVALLVGVTLVGAAPAAAQTRDPIGLRLFLQLWNPAAPDQVNEKPLVDEPTLVSDSLDNAWAALRQPLCDALQARMGRGGAAGGQTLSDITCNLDERITFQVEGQNPLRARASVGAYVEFTSTTPLPAGSWADPRVSGALNLEVNLTLAVQANPAQTLRATTARVTISGATLDSHNTVADVAKFVAEDLIPFFGGPDFKRVAEEALNAVAIDVTGRFDQALRPINARLQAPAGAVRVGVSGSGGYISAAFAQRPLAPPANGAMDGVLRWDRSFTPADGCASFAIDAVVQTGPVPMFVADAVAPTQKVGAFRAQQTGERACSFTLTGLAEGWPNVLTPRIVGGGTSGSGSRSIHGARYALSGDGWEGRIVVPRPRAQGNYAVTYRFESTGIEEPDLKSPHARAGRHSDMVVNPANVVTSRADEASLNPQPLPPRRDSAQANVDAARVGTDAGIIIVGGAGAAGTRQSAPIVAGDRLDALVAKGARLVGEDPRAAALADRQPDDEARRGFHIGVAVAENDTLPGPGKQRIQESLPAAEQEGFAAGVSYSLARNRGRFTDLALKGADLAARDPLTTTLRNQLADGPARLGFDVGLAVAENDTLPGPGKQRIRDSLHASEQAGFAMAVEFSLQRNRNRELARIGASIVQADARLAAARNARADVFYRLGFDIATGLFGDPALGSRGNTVLGPGSMAIRSALSGRAQAGFNDALRHHLNRRY